MQEVVGTDESALDAVVAADAELMTLRAEEAEIQQRLGGISLEDAPEVPSKPSTTAANDADNDRLAAIYDRLEVGGTYLSNPGYQAQPNSCIVRWDTRHLSTCLELGTWQCPVRYMYDSRICCRHCQEGSSVTSLHCCAGDRG